MTSRLPLLAAFALPVAFVAACSGGTSTPNPTTDGGAPDGSGVSDANGAADSGAPTDATVPADSSPSSDDGGIDASEDVGYPAPHPAFPQLVDNGGPVLTTPKIVTVLFAVAADAGVPADAGDAGDTADAGDSGSLASELETFGAQATNNAYWDAVRERYCETGSLTACVGDGPPGTSVTITTAPAASYTDSSSGGTSTLQTYIQGLITATTLAQPDSQTLPIFYFPAGTAITLNGGQSCQDFASYHNEMTAGGVTFAYVVVPTCPPAGGEPGTPLATATFNASDEIAQASTDPTSAGLSFGFYLNFNDPSVLPWNDFFGGEVGDMCTDYLGLGQDQAVEDGFIVHREWNNVAAAAGGDPCVPARAEPYFNVAPEQWLVIIPAVGSTTTFVADAFSNMPVSGGWTLEGVDLDGLNDGKPNEYLTITVNGGATATVNNGDKVTIGVTLNKDPGALAQTGSGAVGVLTSYQGTTRPTATAGFLWPFLAVSEADAIDGGFNTVDAAADLPQVRRSRPHLGKRQRAEIFR